MKSIFFIILTILSIPFSTSFASMLVKEEAPQGGSIDSFSIMRLGPDQGLYLLGERHDFNKIGQEGDKKNFHMLSQILFKAERAKANRTYHVFVEHVVNLKASLENKISPTMMHALLPLAQKNNFQYAVVESCEVRKIVGAVQHIIAYYPNPESPQAHPQWDLLLQRFQEAFGFGLTTITFRDIINEFDRLMAQMTGYRDQWEDPHIKEEFNKSLAEAERCFAYLRGYLLGKNPCGKTCLAAGWITIPVTGPEKFDVDETMFSFCSRDPEQRYISFLSWIEDQMVSGFTNFLDLYLLHRILELRNEADPVKKIVFIGGEAHTSGVYSHLLRAQCVQRIYSIIEGKFTFDKLLKIWKPLSEIESQEKLKKESWCIYL